MPNALCGSNTCRRAGCLPASDGCTAVRVHNADGQYTMTAYPVFPGITFVYNEAHIQSVPRETPERAADDIVEISHCREGRLEYSINGEVCYLEPGDLAIARTSSVSGESYFPLRHYHGLTVRMDLNKTPQCLSCLLDDVKVQPKALAEKFCGRKGGFVARANPSVAHIFSELYSVPGTIQKGYFKVKALELLLFLSTLDLARDETERRRYSRAQAELAKAISKYMMEHKDDRVTLTQLSERFHLSGACIKKLFRGVYGVSVGAYIRTQKMESAAYMLESTGRTILDIANAHGYDNGSKFANAFRSVKGVNPAEYRCRLRAKADKPYPNGV